MVKGGKAINSWFHAQSAARKWGGTPADYLDIEEFIDSSKQVIGDVRHRSLYHHTLGIWVCQRIFGVTRTAGSKQIPVRLIAERHVLEDLGWIPSPADYINGMVLKQWMGGKHETTVGLQTLGLTPAQDVHATHCCVQHGCAYENDSCPVISGTVVQSYACEFCQVETGMEMEKQ